MGRLLAPTVGTMILGASLAQAAHIQDPEPYLFFPLIIHAFDLVVSSVGILAMQVFVRAHGVQTACEPSGSLVLCRREETQGPWRPCNARITLLWRLPQLDYV